MRVHINNMTGGEMAPYMEARTDLPALARGCRLMRNMVPRTTGGAFRRPGMLYQWTARYQDQVACLLPFNFSDQDAFVLEFGHQYVRFGKEGALIESGGNPLTVVAEWGEDDLFQIKYVQVNDIMWGAHEARSPFQLSRLADDNWSLSSVHDLIVDGAGGENNAWPPMLDENTTLTTLTASNTAAGPATLTASADLFVAAQVGSLWEIAHRREDAFDELLIPVFPAASATMDFRVQPIAGQQFTIGGSIYTWVTTLSAAYQVPIGSDIEESRDNALNAINGDSSPTVGDAPGPGTARHPDVVASADELSATNQGASGILTGDGTNRLSYPNINIQTHGTINVVVTVGTIKYGFMANPVDDLFNGATYNVTMGATEKISLQNLVKAINRTGTEGLDYHAPSGVVAHPDVTAALTADNQVTVTAKVGGTAGNSIATVTNNTNFNPEPLNWSAATLTSGGGTETFRLKVEAREVGTSGNDITVGGMYVAVASSSDAGVTNVTNNKIVTLGVKTYTFKTVLTPAANEIFIGANWDASMLNLIRAVNLTGTIGTDYGTGTTINADVFAGDAVTADHQVLFASKTNNPVTAPATTEDEATISFLATTMQPVWNTPTLTGGADVDIASDGVEILGTYKIFSYGLWKGTVLLERRVDVATNTWEVIRQWRGNNDRNIIEEGEAFAPEFLRFRIVDGVGTDASDEDDPRFLIEADNVKIYGLVEIDAVVSATVANVTVIRSLYSTDATAQWSEGAWSDYRGWPKMVAFHEQRLLFGGTSFEPERIWGSATSDFLNFRRGTLDANSWSRVLAADESSRITWGASLGGGLVIGKPREEWLLTSGSADTSITPTTAFAKEQSQYGTADLQPLQIASRLLFVQDGGRNLLEYAYSWEQQNFESGDLAELALHLTRKGFKQLMYAKRPDEIVWAVTTDGKLLSLTYKRRQDASVLAWAWHPTTGTVESVAVINGPNGFDDVYVLVKRTIGETDFRYVEKLDSYTGLALENSAAFYDEWLADPSDANWTDYMAERVLLTYLDSSVRITEDTATTTFTGLDHLNGMTVNVQADGATHPPVVVNGGTITLEREASTVLAGLPYTSQLRSMPFDVSLGDGAASGRKWKVSEITLKYYRTAEGQYSDSPIASTQWQVTIRTGQDPVNAPVPLFTGEKNLVITGTYNPDMGVWTGTSGNEPMNILACSPVFSIHSS